MNGNHWDPADHERVFYRHVLTGDLGYLVRREGKDHIKLDRPMQEVVKPFRAEEWTPEREHRPMTRAQLAQIAFEADKALCRFMGQHEFARREWLSLREETRIAWVEKGPLGGSRKRLFDAVLAALADLAR